jgi:NADH:ubiquinone oxidoreductase subunit H
MILLGGRILSVWFFVKVTLVSWIFIWVRAAFPRYRYDLLI